MSQILENFIITFSKMVPSVFLTLPISAQLQLRKPNFLNMGQWLLLS